MKGSLIELQEYIYESGLQLAESYSNPTSSCFFFSMATFDLIARLCSTGLAEPLESQLPVRSPVTNIELENLDRDGKRSLKRRRRSTSKPVAVG